VVRGSPHAGAQRPAIATAQSPAVSQSGTVLIGLVDYLPAPKEDQAMDEVHDAGTPLLVLVICLLLAAAMGALVILPPRPVREHAGLSEPVLRSAAVENIEVVAPFRPRTHTQGTASRTWP
jgi:hypothetical protein